MTINDELLILADSFQYSSSLTPTMNDFNPKTLYSFGGQQIIIDGSSFASNSHTPMVTIGDHDCDVINHTDTQITCLSPSLAPGTYTIEVDIVEKGNPEYTVSNQVTYQLNLNDIQPRISSVLGGARLTITGRGFSDNMTENQVLIVGNECEIESSSLTSITCIAGKSTKTKVIDNNGVHSSKKFILNSSYYRNESAWNLKIVGNLLRINIVPFFTKF